MSSDPNASGPTPLISHVCQDGTLIETIHDPAKAETALAVCRPGGTTAVVADFDLPTGERLVPYSARNNLLASGCVLLPGDVGEFGDKGDVVRAVQAFIHRYVDLSPAFEEIAAHYVLLTWVYDAFNELPYLRFRGDWGTGKTRALLTIGSVCYKPFFASGASTVSPIFHVLDAFGGTLVLDEADFRFSDATAELTKILNNGTVAGLPVLRTMTNRHRELNPQAFKVFGPKLIAMREDFADRALESRFLTEETGQRPLRSDISISLPAAMQEEARELRNRLLAWRFHARWRVASDPTRLVPDIAPRFNQTALSLLSIIDDAGVRARIAGQLAGEEARAAAERAVSVEAAVLSAIMDVAASLPALPISVRAVAEQFERTALGRAHGSLTAKAVGIVIRTKLRLPTVKMHGTYAIPNAQRSTIAALAARYGIAAQEAA
ncbi:hypothetical protein GCM10023232_08640 [Sphingosinicella ginsenosidimutans]|uniref:DUF3631 domain-containing protein n=1 Tax=Allosphingosinicella ginsenosidimutans TaxID=1176539 RepID=A0A5C6TW45_9SPHN|nr:hypothetical protein [Sphingosinicella ginsenosidimutans]TXC64674.1 hypothetical protein FRZ32_14075 [Sphingosinicella ginsenosidimutans]